MLAKMDALFRNIALNFFVCMSAMSHGIGLLSTRAHPFTQSKLGWGWGWWENSWGLVVNDEVPTTTEMVATIAAFGVLQEAAFYYSHRLMHWGPLYRRVHKVHHEFHSPIALAATYSHPLEFVFQNIAPLVLPHLAARSHIVTFYVACYTGVISTQLAHTGYRFPFPWTFGPDPQPNFHDFHHEASTGNYGLVGLLDRLHGTDLMWREAVKKRGGHGYCYAQSQQQGRPKHKRK